MEHCLIEREAYRIVPEDCRLRCCVELVAIAWVLMRGLLHNHHERKARQHGGLGATMFGYRLLLRPVARAWLEPRGLVAPMLNASSE